jgi:tRNA uridine 5-carbamoylmethylation protein Kti12
LLDEFSSRVAAAEASSARSKTILHIPAQHSLSDSIQDPPVSLRDRIYNSAAAEKNARAAEFSNIKRALTKDAIVISDSLNYIKGYRYQLWCEAKAEGTRCCVIHVAAREDECKRWNKERLRQRGDLAEAEEEETGPGTAKDGLPDAEKKPAGFGDLIPESHTALYGDGGAFEPRSRGSSVDVQLANAPAAPSLTSFPLRDAEFEARPSVASLSLSESSSNEADSSPSTTIADIPDGADTKTNPSSTAPQPPHVPPRFPLSLPYSHDTLQSLILRYEPPSPFSRWDTPLFTIPSTDPTPPYDAIWSVLFPSATPSRKLTAWNGNPNTPATAPDADVVRPHAATVLPPPTSAQALQLLEHTTAEIVTALFAAYKEQNISDEGGDLAITLSSSTEQKNAGSNTEPSLTISIPPATTLTQPMLQRLRRKFTQMQRGGIAHGQGHAVERGRRGVVEAFGRFLEGEFEA